MSELYTTVEKMLLSGTTLGEVFKKCLIWVILVLKLQPQ